MRSEGGVLAVGAPAGAVPDPLPLAHWSVFYAANLFLLRSLARMAALHGDNHASALIFSAIWFANIRHIVHSPSNIAHGAMDALPPDDLRRPVTILALAGMLRLPYETVRRNVRTMLDHRLCVRCDKRGIIVPNETHNQPARRQSLVESYPTLLSFLSDLESGGFDFAPHRQRGAQTVFAPADGSLPGNIRALLRVSMAFILESIGRLARLYDNDMLKGVVFTAILTANARPGGGARHKADGQPLPVRTLAASLRMPYETARRYSCRLIEDGHVARTARGLIVPQERIMSVELGDCVRAINGAVTRLVADLARAGFDFDGFGTVPA